MKAPTRKTSAREIAALIVENTVGQIDDKTVAAKVISNIRQERGKIAAANARKVEKPADPNQFNLFGE